MSIRPIERSDLILLSVRDARKAAAVRDMTTRPTRPIYLGTVLREHATTHLFLDPAAAALLASAA